jgi:hypothetical protein
MTKAFYILIFSLISSFTFAQYSDAGLWLDVTVEKRFNQAFAVEYASSNRLNENLSEYGCSINELGVKYRFSKNSKLAIFYRFRLQKQLNNMYEPISRFYIDYTQEFKLWVLDVDLRCRFQTQQKNVHFYDFDMDLRNKFRPKLKIEYSVMKFTPYFFVESFHPIFYAEYRPIDKIRCAVGLQYAFNNNHSLDLGYMVQQELFKTNSITDYVVRLGYKFRF